MERTHLPTLSGDGIGLRPVGGSSRKARMKPHATILGQPSWRIRSETVEAYVTRLGGQLAPVTFDRRGRRIQPYAVAPWVTEKLDKSTSGIIRALRGDFFCMPFGANQTPFRGERHPEHGETASTRWTFKSLSRSAGRTRLHLSMNTKVRRGRVDKHICLVDGQNALYSQHIISSMSGPMNFGHHATLKFPDAPGSGQISTSKFVYGQTAPERLENPENRGYSILKAAAPFRSLQRVPTITGTNTDLSRYPARRGFEDVAIVVNDQRSKLAWTAVVFPEQRYVWFSLKDPHQLPFTMFWLSNGGRHYPPWNGRHVNVMGLEDLLSYYYMGLAESVSKNPFLKKGYPTYIKLSPRKPLVVNYIMAVATIPRGFDKVSSIRASRDAVTLRSRSGKQVEAAVDTKFLQSSALGGA